MATSKNESMKQGMKSAKADNASKAVSDAGKSTGNGARSERASDTTKKEGREEDNKNTKNR